MPGYRKLGRPAAHRKAMLRNLVTDLLREGRITTTDTRAKEAGREAEKMKWKNFFPPCLKQRIYLLKNVSANSFCPVLVRFHRSLFKGF